MNFADAKAKLDKYGQLHVLNYFDELNDDEKEALLNQIDKTDFEFIELGISNRSEDNKGRISPIDVSSIDEINAEYDRYYETGRRAIADGKVAAVLLAGGMGTRLGSDSPKGVFDIGITKPVFIFQRLIENLLDVVNKVGAYVHLFVMTSDKNNDATIAFFSASDNSFKLSSSLVYTLANIKGV